MEASNSSESSPVDSQYVAKGGDENSSLEDHFHFYRVAGNEQGYSVQMNSSHMPVLTLPTAKSGFQRQRRTVGIVLLLTAVSLWTVMGFVGSSLLATGVYPNSYLMTLANSAFFILPMILILIRHAHDTGYRLSGWQGLLQKRTGAYRLLDDFEYERIKPPAYQLIGNEDFTQSGEHLTESELLGQSMMQDSMVMSTTASEASGKKERATVGKTMKIASELFAIWFFVSILPGYEASGLNSTQGVYASVACLQYTTVASATILASTISVWTLIIGIFLRVERFSLRALLAVALSFAGVVLISLIDISNSDDSESRGSFPSKTAGEIAVGDLIAFFSAVFCGLYAVLLKARIPGEWAINMPLLMSFMGLYSTICLSPGLVILHILGIEKFALPPSGRIYAIILFTSVANIVAESSFAWANLLTSPLTVTVGVAMGIPMAIVGENLINGGSPSFLYWVGAAIVVTGFFILVADKPQENHETAIENET